MIPGAIADYELLIYNLHDTFPSILTTTLHLIRTGSASGRMIGDLTFSGNIRLNVAELVDFDAGQLEILQYGYVVWRGAERLYWYDSGAFHLLKTQRREHSQMRPDGI